MALSSARLAAFSALFSASAARELSPSTERVQARSPLSSPRPVAVSGLRRRLRAISASMKAFSAWAVAGSEAAGAGAASARAAAGARAASEAAPESRLRRLSIIGHPVNRGGPPARHLVDRVRRCAGARQAGLPASRPIAAASRRRPPGPWRSSRAAPARPRARPPGRRGRRGRRSICPRTPGPARRSGRGAGRPGCRLRWRIPRRPRRPGRQFNHPPEEEVVGVAQRPLALVVR